MCLYIYRYMIYMIIQKCHFMENYNLLRIYLPLIFVVMESVGPWLIVTYILMEISAAGSNTPDEVEY